MATGRRSRGPDGVPLVGAQLVARSLGTRGRRWLALALLAGGGAATWKLYHHLAENFEAGDTNELLRYEYAMTLCAVTASVHSGG